MKKAFFKLMLLVLGLNVFTACYGPAPGGWPYDDPVEETSDETKAAEEEEAPAAEESSESTEEAQ